MPTQEEAEEFWKKFEALIQPHSPGKMKIEPAKVAELVKTNPELAIVLAQSYVQAAVGGKPAFFGTAHVLGVAYQLVTDDDSLVRYVEREMKAAGTSDKMPQVLPDPEAKPAAPPGVHLNVIPENLKNQDIYWLVKTLSPLHYEAVAERRKLADFRGRCLLTFDVQDPREVWEIPSVRKFAAKLHLAMPYLPYYLVGHPEANFKMIYFFCLAKRSAFLGQRMVAFTHPAVWRPLVQTYQSLAVFCAEVGDDVTSARRELLASLVPESEVDGLIALLESGQYSWINKWKRKLAWRRLWNWLRRGGGQSQKPNST